jgi:hypothetical protein
MAAVLDGPAVAARRYASGGTPTVQWRCRRSQLGLDSELAAAPRAVRLTKAGQEALTAAFGPHPCSPTPAPTMRS